MIAAGLRPIGGRRPIALRFALVLVAASCSGTLDAGKVFYDSTPWIKQQTPQKPRPGLPDGMKVDQKGNLFATGPGGVCIFSPDGKHLGTLNTGEPTANCGFGDDGLTLYITANKYLCRIRTATKGM